MCWGPTRKNWQEILQRHCVDGKRARVGFGSSVSVGSDHWKPQFRLAKPPEDWQYAGIDHNLCTGSLVRRARTDLQSRVLWAHKNPQVQRRSNLLLILLTFVDICWHLLTFENDIKRQDKGWKGWQCRISTCFCKVHAWRIAIGRVFAFRHRGSLFCACLSDSLSDSLSDLSVSRELTFQSIRCSKCSPPDCLCLSSLSNPNGGFLK